MHIGVGTRAGRTPGRDEVGALRAALDVAARDLETLSTRAGTIARDCLEVQLALLDDAALVAPALESIAKGVPADAAWRRVMDDLIGVYAADPSGYVQARGVDVADLRDRVIEALHEGRAAPGPPPGAIIVAEDLPPSRFVEIDWAPGGGIALARGSAMSHTAILARAHGVPMIVQTGVLPTAARALMDADRGLVELDPPDEARQTFGSRGSRGVTATAQVHLSAPATYRGERVALMLNIESAESLSHPSARFADGVGLMRTEYLFLGHPEPPDEEAQLEAYGAVLRWAGGRPVTIRTIDAGGDKSLPGFSESDEANPALGLRGLRLSLRRPELFATQLRALARASVFGPLKVMFPFVTAPPELEAARTLFQHAVDELRREGRDARLPELGMMVEVPAAALTLASFDAAFFSIGANDLAQFVLACDRTNGALDQLYDPMHPAVVGLIGRVVMECIASSRSVSLCGDVAGNPEHTLALLQCGLRELSMSANALATVKSNILQGMEARIG